MTFRKLLMPLLLASSLFSSTVFAMDLNDAMSHLGPAKAAGLLGEQPNGYLGVVKAQGNAAEIETMAGKKALEKTPAGQYIQLNGKWLTK